jgi:hypothetical protein
MSDRSVRFYTNGIASTVWQALGTMLGGEAVGEV